MPKKKPGETVESPLSSKIPEIIPPFDPEESITPVEDPDIMPDEDPFETSPYELPPSGEGP